ncbi:MAG TPA: hypothetical protein VGO45_09700 [Bacteroidia bacterium]|jgi:hypothetical protein|nr:hypothetical protein [Bacteroidia bacterium]
METNSTNKNGNRLSEQDLRNKMDFDKFMKDYKPRPLYKSWKFYLAVAAAALMIYGAYRISQDDNENTFVEKNTAVAAYIKPVLPGADVLPVSFQLKSGTDTVLAYLKGTLLHIPANAFLDSKGNKVQGRVELRYREMHRLSEFFVSGIPMTYDSAGHQYCFESAGLLEIAAFQDGLPVFANPKQPIRIVMLSDVASSRFNIYYLDTTAHAWSFIRKDFMLASRYSDGSSATARFYALLNEPRKADAAQARFNISFDKKEFPELAEYDGVAFEVNQEEQTYDPKLAMKDWESVKVERMQDGVHYLVTFANGNETHSFRVVPVFEGTDYVLAEKMYKQKIKAYEKALSAEKSRVDTKERAGDASVDTRPVETEGHLLVSGAQRAFEVNRFGIWNSACLHSLPVGKLVNAKFSDAGNAAFVFSRIYFSEKGRKILFTFNPEKQKTFAFNPNERNTIWGVNAGGHVVVFNEQDLEKKTGMGTGGTDAVPVAGRQVSLAELKKSVDQ